MKTLSDGNEVSDATYYYLLDWNERNNKNFINKNFNKNSLRYLTLEEYLILWQYATTSDYNDKCK